MKTLEMNATVLNEEELLAVDGGSWQDVTNICGKIGYICNIGIAAGSIYLSGGVAAADPLVWTDMGAAAIDFFS